MTFARWRALAVRVALHWLGLESDIDDELHDELARVLAREPTAADCAAVKRQAAVELRSIEWNVT